MPSVQACALPPRSLLSRYAEDGNFTDCYVIDVPRSVSQPEFVEALYLGALMRIERRLIGWFLSRPTSSADVRELAVGASNRFAAWLVEARTPNELLLQDQTGRTRSWLMSQPMPGATRLYFGSALLPRVDRTTGVKRMGPLFKPMLGFHARYSRLLLSAARSRLQAVPGAAA